MASIWRTAAATARTRSGAFGSTAWVVTAKPRSTTETRRIGLGALGLDYRGERFRWTLDAISQNEDTRNFRPQMAIQTTVPFIPAPPDARSNWYPGTALKQRDNTIASAAEYDLCEWLTAYAGVGYRDGMTRRRSLTPASRLPGGMDQFGNFNASMPTTTSTARRRAAMSGMRSRFQIGAVGHAVNVAFTGYYQEIGFALCANTPAQSVPSNIYNPSPLPVVAGGRPPRKAESEITLKSFALSDTMSFLNDMVLLTVGARYQTVEPGSFTPTHKRPDEQLQRRSDDASRRPCRQAVAQCLALRELR